MASTFGSEGCAGAGVAEHEPGGMPPIPTTA